MAAAISLPLGVDPNHLARAREQQDNSVVSDTAATQTRPAPQGWSVAFSRAASALMSELNG